MIMIIHVQWLLPWLQRLVTIQLRAIYVGIEKTRTIKHIY